MSECLLAAIPPGAPQTTLTALDANLGPAGAASLREALILAMGSRPEGGRAGPVVRLEAGAVEQLSTCSLQLLLAAAGQLRKQGGRLMLTGPNPRLCEWVRLAGAGWLVEDEGGPAGAGRGEER